MMNFRIDVVRSSGKHDTSAAGFFHILQRLFPFFLHITSCSGELLPSGMDSGADLILRQAGKFFCQAVGENLFTRKCEERIAECDGVVLELIHIVFDVLRVGSNDRAVIVVDGLRELGTLVRDTRIEDEFYAVA